MQISQDGIDLIKEFEGCELDAYADSTGRMTIGYGHTADVYEGMTITQSQADIYLSWDLEEFEQYVNDYVTVPLAQHQFDALVSFTYNLGPGTLQRSDLLAFVNAYQVSQAADAFLEYDHAGGVEVPGLLRRREAERAMFLSPPSLMKRLGRRWRLWRIGK
jgi:lysozyme